MQTTFDKYGGLKSKRPVKPVATNVQVLRTLFHYISDKDYTLDSVAKQNLLTRQTLAGWRDGCRMPRIDDVSAVADSLGLELVLRPKA
jgi:DNA-binding phage protein